MADSRVTEARQVVNDLKAFDYPKSASLEQEADMVMKGGITSGVVYPLAVCELAKKRRFRNLGGSSAGGIAAALAAVAELARDRGGFQRLAAVPDDLGANLLKIFQPSKRTRPLFAILLAGMGDKRGPVLKALRIAGAIVNGAKGAFTAAFVGVLVLGMWGVMFVTGAPRTAKQWWHLFGALPFLLLPALIVAFLAAVIGLVMTGKKRLEANGYGLVLGSNGANWPTNAPAPKDVEPFADWLHARINHIAGVGRGDIVTFKDLKEHEYPIRLEMMTTNVTMCRPVRLPFESNVYLFCPEELARYFPPPVIAHLVANAKPSESGTKWSCPSHADGEHPLLHLPVGQDLPIILAVRMTLSFPGLISAVPLYAVDYASADPVPIRCWFSDGGISSNFPIHFFDALWPRRPTFGISLSPYPPDRPHADVYLRGATRAAQPRVRDTRSLTSFVAAILDTLQNWSDEGQATLPGYRDRIVEVHHAENEGGLNLTMSEESILSLCLRGYKAAVALEKFNFEQHRWARYRLAMAKLQEAVGDMATKYDDPLPDGADGYRAFLSDLPGKLTPKETDGWLAGAVDRTDLLLAFAGRPWTAPDDGLPGPNKPDFTDDAPRPSPDLRITAHF
jgi:predicted acylesterase/phospholipase RssA